MSDKPLFPALQAVVMFSARQARRVQVASTSLIKPATSLPQAV